MLVSPKATILDQSKNNYYYQMFFLKRKKQLKKWLFKSSVLCFCNYLDFCNKDEKNHGTYKEDILIC